MRVSASGRTAPSFILAVAGVLVAVLGYLAWETLRTTPYQESEEIVRQFARSAAGEVGNFRRAARATSRGAPDQRVLPETIDALAAAAVSRLDDAATGACERLEGMQGIRPRTRENRLRRIEQRRQESEAAIVAAAAEAGRGRQRDDAD